MCEPHFEFCKMIDHNRLQVYRAPVYIIIYTDRLHLHSKDLARNSRNMQIFCWSSDVCRACCVRGGGVLEEEGVSPLIDTDSSVLYGTYSDSDRIETGLYCNWDMQYDWLGWPPCASCHAWAPHVITYYIRPSRQDRQTDRQTDLTDMTDSLGWNLHVPCRMLFFLAFKIKKRKSKRKKI